VSLNATIAYGGLQALRVPALSRRFRNAGVVLCYHNVVANGDATLGDPGLHMPIARFERQMRWLAEHYRVVSLRELIERLRTGQSLRGVAALTFDDGYNGVFDYGLPVLDALRLPATVFLVAESLDRADPGGFWWDHPAVAAASTPQQRNRWLNEFRGDAAAILSQHSSAGDAKPTIPRSRRSVEWSSVQGRLRGLIDLGVHSATHRALPTLTEAELRHEIVASRDVLQRVTGVSPQFFSYPYGLWDARVREMVCAAGYRAAVTLECGLNGPSADPWALRRVNVPAAISDPAFEAWMAGFQPFHGHRGPAIPK
jgi:peptidoglycan/xylan/chitin deacetylase (PgdA/CDA1 family)